MAKFFMMIGLPGSGKSVEAAKIAKMENAVIVSSDAIRKELYGDENCQDDPQTVFDVAFARIYRILEDGYNVVFDATNLNSKKRRHLLQSIKKYKTENIAVFMATPFDECLKRNEGRERVVPAYVIKKMYMGFNVPCKQEGFDEVKVVYPDNFKFRLPLWSLEQCRIPHDNPHHTSPIDKHMYMAHEHLLDNYGNVMTEELVNAVLFHDIGKPFTKTFINSKGETTEEAHYYSHNNVGAYDIFFLDLSQTVDKINVALLIQYHMNYHTSWKQSEKAKEKDRLFLGEELFNELTILHDCDVNAH